MEYVGKKMIVDTKKADGSVFFYKDYFEFVPRYDSQKQFGFSIYYKDVVSMNVSKGIKCVTTIKLTDDKTCFLYNHRPDTLVALINAGRDAVKNGTDYVDADFTVKNEPLTNEEIDKLTKLNELHKSGVLSDEEFEAQKNYILHK